MRYAILLLLAFTGPVVAADPPAKALALWSWNVQQPTYAETFRHVQEGGVAVVCVGVKAIQIEGFHVHAAKAIDGYETGYHVCSIVGKEMQCSRLLVEPTAEAILARVKEHNSAKAGITPELIPLVVAPARAAPYRDPPGTHRHQCPHDGFVWSHRPGGSHACPQCGRESKATHSHYTGPLPPSTLAPRPAPAKPQRISMNGRIVDECST